MPTVLGPLLLVLAMTAVKDAVEDYSRHVADSIENKRETARLGKNNIKDPQMITSAQVRPRVSRNRKTSKQNFVSPPRCASATL